LFDIRVISDNIPDGKGKTMKATKIRSLMCGDQQKDSLTIILQEVKLVPEFGINLFNIKTRNDG
jgi:hypothetical protein